MKLLIQPGDGATPLVKAIDSAKRSIEIVIFRFDHPAIEKALAAAVKRGVEVTALIACTNRGGEDALRKLEQRLLAWGATVARSADDLARYHAKLLIVDRKQFFVLAFNFTRLDIERSRGIGYMTTSRRVVLEAVRLFEADSKRQPYEAGLKSLIVSPSNAREQLAAFLEGAKDELLIYDPEVSDPAMLRILAARAAKGVAVRVIGTVKKQPAGIVVRERPKLRLHTRTIVRDGQHVFIGSQSLRPNELDKRREVGIIFDNRRIAARIASLFEEDWSTAKGAPAAGALAKSVANAVAEALPPVAPAIAEAMRNLTGANGSVNINKRAVEERVKDVVKDALKDIVRDAVDKAS